MSHPSHPIEVSVEVQAEPRDVWQVVSDLRRMGEWSPQCRRMFVLGDVRRGARAVNVNRQGLLVWPTTARVVRYEPQRAIAFRIPLNGTVWTYELEPTVTGTRVTERREAPHGITRLSHLLTDRFPGGTDRFEVDLERGMRRTLERVKAEVEASALPHAA
ncbi:SRPBCC family protein [Solicola sp. PLA-1-18]|uniref:SRPBCC family protein n=1 Tax=Solicola sp. PLA-1-18 TaxID=3380532 RepID=UPI003B7F18E9